MTRELTSPTPCPETGPFGRPSTPRLLAQTVLSSLGNGFGFLPIVALAAVAAPARGEAAVFALVITAQSAGTLVAAAIAASMAVAMDVGAPAPLATKLGWLDPSESLARNVCHDVLYMYKP